MTMSNDALLVNSQLNSKFEPIKMYDKFFLGKLEPIE